MLRCVFLFVCMMRWVRMSPRAVPFCRPAFLNTHTSKNAHRHTQTQTQTPAATNLTKNKNKKVRTLLLRVPAVVHLEEGPQLLHARRRQLAPSHRRRRRWWRRLLLLLVVCPLQGCGGGGRPLFVLPLLPCLLLQRRLLVLLVLGRALGAAEGLGVLCGVDLRTNGRDLHVVAMSGRKARWTGRIEGAADSRTQTCMHASPTSIMPSSKRAQSSLTVTRLQELTVANASFPPAHLLCIIGMLCAFGLGACEWWVIGGGGGW